MGGKKNWLAIDTAALITYEVNKIWEEKPSAGILLMDVEEVLDYVSWAKLV